VERLYAAVRHFVQPLGADRSMSVEIERMAMQVRTGVFDPEPSHA
jgi:histidine ammonia-lyase